MKPVKFRAWDVMKGSWIHPRAVSVSGDGTVCVLDGPTGEWPVADPDVVKIVWSIDLHDKNGKEIWEGDVVQMPPIKSRFTVFFVNGGFYPFANEDPVDHEFTEVIGNIYENPELVK